MLIRYLYSFMDGNIGDIVTEDTCLKPYGYFELRVSCLQYYLELESEIKEKIQGVVAVVDYQTRKKSQ